MRGAVRNVRLRCCSGIAPIDSDSGARLAAAIADG